MTLEGRQAIGGTVVLVVVIAAVVLTVLGHLVALLVALAFFGGLHLYRWVEQ